MSLLSKLFQILILAALFSINAYADVTSMSINDGTTNTGVIIINGKVVSGNVVTGSGKVKSESRDIGAFKDVEINIPAAVTISQEEDFGLELSADENVLPKIVTRVTKDKLEISNQESYATSNPIRITLTAPMVRKLLVHSSATVDIVSIRQDELTIHSDSAAEISGSGKVARLRLRADGASEMDLSELIADEVQVQASGSADLQVHAQTSFDGNASGAASVLVAGGAKFKRAEVTGAADIERQ